MRRTIAMTVSVLLSAAALVVLGPAAHADNGACPTNAFCLFEHDNFLGGRKAFTASGGDHGRYPDLRKVFWEGTTRPVHDGASSMINKFDHRVVLFGDVGCGGGSYSARENSEDRDFTNNNFDNKADCVIFSSSG